MPSLSCRLSYHANRRCNTSKGSLPPWLDQDWFKVTLTAGTEYRFTAQGRWFGYEQGRFSFFVPEEDRELFGTIRNPVIRGLFDPDGNRIPETRSHVSWAEFLAPADGDYYVVVDGRDLPLHYLPLIGQNIYPVTINGTYTVTARRADDDYIAGRTTTGVVTPDGGRVQGRIDYDTDVDWFRFPVEPDKSYQVSVYGQSLSDPMIKGIYLRDGTLIAGSADDNSGNGMDALTQVAAPSSDRFMFVSVSGDGTATGTGNYRLEVFGTEETLRLSSGTAGSNPTRSLNEGADISATLIDPDGGITGTTWQWARSMSQSGPWLGFTHNLEKV